jgi:hypothetical protein
MENQEVKIIEQNPSFLRITANSGELLVEIDESLNVVFLKDAERMDEATRLFWESMGGSFFAVSSELVENTPNDSELGDIVRKLYFAKKENLKTGK